MKIRWIPEFDYAGRKSYDSLKTRNDAQNKNENGQKANQPWRRRRVGV
jgi:hypothetical protein